jgi:hypothetical protein
MSDASPHIDLENLPAPSEGILVTLFLTVRDTAASCDFYSRILGGTVVLEGTPSIIKLSNSWIIMNSGGGPTPDKPGISVVNYEPGDTTLRSCSTCASPMSRPATGSGARMAPPSSRHRSIAGPKSAATSVIRMATSSRWAKRPACSGTHRYE